VEEDVLADLLDGIQIETETGHMGLISWWNTTTTMVNLFTLETIVTWRGGILHDGIITQPDTPPTLRLLTPDNSDGIGTIRNSQGSNSRDRARIVKLCAQVHTYVI
jgi:hypothetical protein